LRTSTERPETVTIGTNVLAGIEQEVIKNYLKILHAGTWKKGSIPALWDGQTANRIVEILGNLKLQA
jgi:UDP-N-acetylglucosamine 2-epimerase (non-hydrolysing)